MRIWIQMVLVLAGLLLLSGCGLVGHYEIKGENMLTLDQAIARAKSNEYSCVSNLWALWEQAPPEDKIVVEQEILKVILQSKDTYREPKEDALQDLRSRAYSEEVKKAVDDALRQCRLAREARAAEEKKKQEAAEVERRKHAEQICLNLQESRTRLIGLAGGRLEDKSAEDVKKLVDDWTHVEGVWELDKDQIAKILGTSVFYRTFGQPERKQFISGDNIFSSGRYYFYYQCRDGTVQMVVNANALDKEGCILLSDLNIL